MPNLKLAAKMGTYIGCLYLWVALTCTLVRYTPYSLSKGGLTITKILQIQEQNPDRSIKHYWCAFIKWTRCNIDVLRNKAKKK